MRGRGVVSGSPHRAAPHRVARRAPAPAARPGARAGARRLRGTAPAVRGRRQRTHPGAGTRRCGADGRRPSAADRRRRGSSRRRLPPAGRRTAGSPRQSPRAPGGDICRAHARRRPGRRPPSEWGGPAAGRSRVGGTRPQGSSARPVSGSVSASDLPDAAVQLHCLDPHGAGTLTPSLGLCPCQQGAAGVQHGRVSACVDCGT